MVHKPGSPREFSASLENRAERDPLPSSPPPLARGLASPFAPLPAQPPYPAPRAQLRVQNRPGNCSEAAGVQKSQAGHPWRRNTLAGFKQTSPAPGSTVVISSIKIPSGAVQWG